MTDEELLSSIRVLLLEPLQCELWELERDPDISTLSYKNRLYRDKREARGSILELIRRYRKLKETKDDH